ncbi:UNVERIFIED_CONTAM: hypothetical protein Sradi_1547400 [Sesamum radiatum]|uniref:Uncharacterized protein n=1 Tax=Sesamum radiatum TaxID=300843 RepID=A0AAW2U996_SESRA
MNSAQRRVFDEVVLSYFSSYHDGVSDDGTRSCSTDVDLSSYYEGGHYDYVLGLSDHLYNVVHAVDQPFWSGCTQFQLVSIASFVGIKAEDHIFEQTYDHISQWDNNILSLNHTLTRDYYNTKKLNKNFGLPVEKIDECKNGYMLYWKDDVDLEYYKFCGDARYKPMREQDSRCKKSPYSVLRHPPLTPLYRDCML